MYQISNQVTLGRSEQDIIDSLSTLVKQLVDYEINARKYLVKNYKLELEDSVGRAYGIMSGARRISSEESMRLLSSIRLGAERKLIIDIKPTDLNKIMLDIQPGTLQQIAHERLDANNRDIMRATILRKRLKK
jgi:protein arginine kinase